MYFFWILTIIFQIEVTQLEGPTAADTDTGSGGMYDSENGDVDDDLGM